MKNNLDILERAKEFFNYLNKDTMESVNDFYDENIVFKDPLVSFTNRKALRDYYQGLYNNVSSIHFTFENEVVTESECTFSWSMHMVCGLNGGKPMVVDGISTIRFGGKEGKAIFHRDYYDMGEFVYERIPIVKNIISVIKKKMLEH